MATVVAGMTTSLDGFVDGPDGSASRLYPDLAALQGTAYMRDSELEHVRLEKIGVQEVGARTSLAFRVQK